MAGRGGAVLAGLGNILAETAREMRRLTNSLPQAKMPSSAMERLSLQEKASILRRFSLGGLKQRNDKSKGNPQVFLNNSNGIVPCRKVT